LCSLSCTASRFVEGIGFDRLQLIDALPEYLQQLRLHSVAASKSPTVDRLHLRQQTIVTELSSEGQVKLEVMQSLLEPCDRVTSGQRLRDGAQKLDISVRSVQRLFKKYQEQGLVALITTERAVRAASAIVERWLLRSL
jgi:hypothetical protein